MSPILFIIWIISAFIAGVFCAHKIVEFAINNVKAYRAQVIEYMVVNFSKETYDTFNMIYEFQHDHDNQVTYIIPKSDKHGRLPKEEHEKWLASLTHKPKLKTPSTRP